MYVVLVSSFELLEYYIVLPVEVLIKFIKQTKCNKKGFLDL